MWLVCLTAGGYAQLGCFVLATCDHIFSQTRTIDLVVIHGQKRRHVLKQFLENTFRHQIKPFKAIQSARKLVSDPNDTTQVFQIIEALKGDSLARALTKLRSTDAGRELLLRRPNIVRLLNDRVRLKSLPKGSVGRAYYDFVHRQNLSANELIRSSRAAPQYIGLSDEESWLASRLRDIHDLQHVMTGYGRDPVGELSLLSFMTTQTPNRGINFIIWVGKMKYRREVQEFDIRELIEEGAQIARDAQWMPGISWEKSLSEQLADVRSELGFKPPLVYQRLREEAPQLLLARWTSK